MTQDIIIIRKIRLKLKSKFRIPENINDYNLTKEFLVKVLYMLNDFKYGENTSEENSSIEDDFPF